MCTLTRNRFLAICAGLILLVSACSSTGGAPESLAFEDPSTDSSGNLIEDAEADTAVDSSTDASDETTTTVEATTTTAAPTTTSVPTVPRPNLTCSSSDYSVAFPDNITLVSPVLTSAGPFSIAVPEGTYEITLQSWLGAIEFPRHTMEQWFFTTDSGYTSPLTTDHSPNLVGADTITAVIPAGTTSVSLFHKPQDTDINNSVQPLCIGFDALEAPATTTTAAPATTVAPETTTAAPETTTAAPETTTAAPETTTTAAPSPTTTEAASGSDTGVAAGGLANNAATTTTVATTSTSETVPAELALTGPGDLSFSLGLAGAALTLAGAGALIASRRNEEE